MFCYTQNILRSALLSAVDFSLLNVMKSFKIIDLNDAKILNNNLHFILKVCTFYMNGSGSNSGSYEWQRVKH